MFTLLYLHLLQRGITEKKSQRLVLKKEKKIADIRMLPYFFFKFFVQIRDKK